MPWKKQKGAPAVSRTTHEIDAAGMVVGRLATKIAALLQGKTKASFVPHIDAGDFVKIKNVQDVVLTGKKMEQKVHFRTSNRPGGLKRTSMTKLKAERPEEILRHAVKYMLPKNRTQSVRLKRLTFVN